MERPRQVVFAATLLGAEVAAVVALYRFGSVDGFALPSGAPVHWLRHASTEELVAVIARVAGLALASWLLLATALSVARRLVPAWRTWRALDSITPAVLRHFLDRGVAIGLGASLGLAGLHGAGAAQPTAARVDTPVVRSPNPPPKPERTPAPAAPLPRQSVPRQTGAAIVVVRAGDNLWTIARHALETHDGATAQPREIAPYWQRVIAANAATLRSHDPNLIFPGERVVLPPQRAGERPAG